MAITKIFKAQAPNPHAYYESSTGEPTVNVGGNVTIVNSDGDEVSIGGGSAGGGNNTYSNIANSITATPTVGTTNIVMAGLPFTLEDGSVALGSIKKIDSSGNITSLILTNVTVSSNTITLTDETNFVSGDTVDVVLVGPDKAYDTSLDINKVIDQSPLWSRYTSADTIISATPYELTASFADVGSEIDVRGYNFLTLWVTLDIGTSTDTEIRILHKHESAGSDEYREIYLGSPAGLVSTVNLNDYQIASDANQLFKLTINVIGVHYIQIQAKDAANGDGQIDYLYVTKSWGA